MVVNFNKDMLTDLNLLTRNECIIFALFLWTEKLRHEKDIIDLESLLDRMQKLHNFEIGEEFRKRALAFTENREGFRADINKAIRER